MTTIALILLTASSTFHLPAGLLSAVCWTESSHRPKVVHLDDGTENSVGLCQLHLGTARMEGFTGNDSELLDPKVNAKYAAKYLKHQLSRYNGDVIKAIAAYNSGSYVADEKGAAKNSKYVGKVIKAWVEQR